MKKTQKSKGQAIIRLVADYYDVSQEQLIAQRRGNARTSFARQVVMSLAFAVAGMTHADAGRLVRRTQSNVACAKKTVHDLCDVDPAVKQQWDFLYAAATKIINENENT